MRRLKNFYFRSGWYEVFNFTGEAATARSYLLLQVIISAVINGFTGGVFYTGYLVGHGINIVNISILALVPYAACLFSVLTPYILERFPKRRWILSIARLAYFTLQILGVSLLPLIVHSDTGRVVGLVVIVFLANVINFLFNGYSPWHMPYITQDVRMNYFTATQMVSNVTSTVVLIITSIITDRLHADDQLNLISVLRYVAFGLCFLDIYFLQKPKEPVYLKSANQPKLLDIFRLPLSNKSFMVAMLVMFFYHFILNFSASVQNTWLLQTVNTGYLYINIINGVYILFIIFTSKVWSRVMQRKGTFFSLALSMLLLAPTYIAYAFVSNNNFIWLMTIVRLAQHGVGMLQSYSASNVIYLALPEKDQTCYISFNTIVAHLAVLLSMLSGTGVVAALGDSRVNILGISMDSVQLLLLATGALLVGFTALIILLKKSLPQEKLHP